MTTARGVQPSASPSTGDTVLDIEASGEDCLPIELIDIVHGSVTYRITTGTHDTMYDGIIYTAIAAARGEIGPASTGAEREMALTLPINHAFVRRYLQQGIPPKQIVVTLRRLFLPSEEIETRWIGDITSMACDDEGTEATFRVPSRMSEHMLRVIPDVPVDRKCPHALYDTMCGIARTATGPDGFPYKHTTTVMHVNGREVRLDLSTVTAGHDRRADWLEEGELVHVASGERMTIKLQEDANPGVSTVTVVSMESPIVGMKVGDSIEVYAGCKLEIIDHCAAKFANKLRHGGFPKLSTSNPFTPSGYGVANKI